MLVGHHVTPGYLLNSAGTKREYAAGGLDRPSGADFNGG
jgi:hypothetical protein